MTTSHEEQRDTGAGMGVPPQPSAPPPPPPPPYGADPRAAAAPGWTSRWGSPLEGQRKSVPLAAILSFFMPGLGQVYLGYYQRGFTHALIFAGTIALLASGAVRGAEPLFGIFLGFFYLYNVVDAARRASFYNQALAGAAPIPLPEDFKLPGERGSLVGGGLLAAFGLLLFLHTRFDYDLDWLADWWPLVLVAIGLNLVYKAVRARQKGA